ncbi:MAG: alpha-2-macroglobulin [Acidobacteriia bacterium]|nr:alpha-2-macroglobulin [Terriglobia bacterium]
MLTRTKLFRLLVLFAAAAAGLSQSENEPYFSLSSFRTFGSNGKPQVGLSAWNVDSLEFRLYRIQDPLKFFQQIEDPHQFGGRAPQPPRERTLLERIHIWKHALRTDIRRSLRAQFNEPPSAHFESLFPRQSKPGPASKETQYAEAPVLNSQQLVLSFVQPVRSRTRWDRQNVDLNVRDKGVYLVEAVRKDLRAYTLLIVSDLVMISKTGDGRIVNLVVDRNTGQPLEGVSIAMLTKDGEAGSAQTNGDGIAELRWSAVKEGGLRLVARNTRDVAVNIIPTGSSGPNADQWNGYIYTDRPVYRPGHTVHFKGVLRLRKPDGYLIPAGRSVNVEVNDSDQKPVYQKTLTVSANGTIHDDITLAPSATLGNYYIQAKSGDGFMSGNFEVQEYKKPEYEVRVTPAKPRVLQGENVQAIVDARYYFGEPVSGAKVKYTVYRQRYWFPLWYDSDESFQPSTPDDSDDAGDQVGEQDGQLDADGKLTVNIPTSVSDHKFDYVYRVDARVTDAANREITGSGWVLATYGSFALNVSPKQYLYAPGSKAAFTVQARDYDNKPVSTRVHVELLQWNFKDTRKSQVKGATDVTLGAEGSADASLDIPAQGGTYLVRVSAHSPEGRDPEASSYLWVSGSGGWNVDQGANEAVQIIPDQKVYRAGDTAKLLIVTGQANTPVLVAVEGLDIRQHKLLRSQDATVSFDVPIAASDEPGISVTAAFVRNGVFHSGSKYLKVPPAQHQLNVKLTTDKPQYLPGQTAEYSIDVSGADGKPVPRADLSLGVVDEAIYGIRRDMTEDILTFFYGHDYNRVYTDSSLEYYFNGEAGKRRMRLAELRPPSRLAQLKPERLVQAKIRKAFPDTAFWAADVTTDASGHARAKVEFPDSLTTWRATARAVTPETKVGGAVLKTIVRKNLILRLAVPRFFVQGDEVLISALVHNYLTDEKTARVSLDVQGLEVLEGATKDVKIPSRGEAKVDWKVRAGQVRSVTITGKALTNEESDALELQLPVDIPGVKLSQARGGSLAPGASAAFDLTFPDRIQPGSRSISVRVSPSLVGSLFGALDYLTSFPYGCVEQIMSSFLPNIVVEDAVRSLGLKVDLDEAALQEKIRAGLDRLYSFQHEDGGWGWWETDESHPFMTAYVVAGLVQAQSAGTKINPDAITKGVAWLKKDFAADPKLASDLRAYMQYALVVAGQADAIALGQVYDKRSNLSPYGLALLGLALEQAKDARAGEMAAALEQQAHQDQEQAWWTATRDQMLDFSEDLTPEATAYVAKFLAHQRKDSALLPKAAQWLMNHRDEGYWWSSTKQTAMVIYGLIDYLKTTNELKPNLTATVFVNDQPVLTRKIDQAASLNLPDLVLDESKLAAGVNHIRVATSGQGRLYYSTRAEYYSTEQRFQKTGSVSLNLLRDYFRLAPAKVGDRIVYDTAPLEGPVSAGDIIAVRLTVTGSEWKYLMLEDPIPAGTEFIERDNLYELRNRPPWWRFLFTRRELHDDRMAIFQTYFPQGQQQYFYLLKVVNPGVFQVSPARVGPMYQTDVMATSESRRLEAK